jgi:hypothetical protein
VPRVAEPIRLEVSDRLELQRWVVAHTTPQQVTQRCRIILAAADGCGDKDIAEELEVNFKTVAFGDRVSAAKALTAYGKWLRVVGENQPILKRKWQP